MMLPIVYHRLYSAPQLRPGHRFPMGVFQEIFNTLLSDGLITMDQVHIPDKLVDKDVLELAHCPEYVGHFLNGTLDAQKTRRIGFGDQTKTQTLIDRTCAEVSGTILTAELALTHGLACSVAGGTHHGFKDFGSGFCILNDLVVTSKYLLAGQRVKKILIVDLDVHQGDGTASLCEGDDRIFTFSMHAMSNFPARKQRSDLDIALRDGCGDEEYLQTLSAALPRLLQREKPDIVLFDAGVDTHRDDELGKLGLTDDGLVRREMTVIDTCLGHDIPVAGYVGGGYAKDLSVLAKRHIHLHHACLEMWKLFSL